MTSTLLLEEIVGKQTLLPTAMETANLGYNLGYDPSLLDQP